ncbi:MAG: glycosyltransferase family 1 protein [Bacilli bacterium]|nr:glycosyltransferase family 1 protein [Bacilli bacterium]
MRKALVISWYFPPINSSEGLVTFKLLKNSRYKYDVFTQKGNLSWTYGDNANKLVSENITPIFSTKSDIKEWIEEGVEYIRKNHQKYDYIMSRSMAPESHVIALRVKQEFPEIKWIASFGDPISDNPFSHYYEQVSPHQAKGVLSGEVGLKYFLSPKRIIKNTIWQIRHKRYLRKFDTEKEKEKLQNSTLNMADVIILNSEYQKNHMLSSYNGNIQDKVVILPHSYDSDFYPKNKKEKHDKIKFTYLGHLDEIRTPKKFLEAIDRLNKTVKNLKDKIEVEFYGNLGDHDKLYIVDNYLCDIVKFKAPVDYFESLNIMKNTDWLLSFDANLSKYVQQNIFFPAKVADYIGSKTKMLGVTMFEGASADVFREVGALICSYSSDEIYMYLKMIIEDKLEIKMKNTQKYDAKNVAKEYDKMVENRFGGKNEKN